LIVPVDDETKLETQIALLRRDVHQISESMAVMAKVLERLTRQEEKLGSLRDRVTIVERQNSDLVSDMVALKQARASQRPINRLFENVAAGFVAAVVSALAALIFVNRNGG
jgi:uncharacterized protein (DUF2236 family)